MSALQEAKYANSMRFQIVAGRLYLDFTQFRTPDRQLKATEVPYWFPADVRLTASWAPAPRCSSLTQTVFLCLLAALPVASGRLMTLCGDSKKHRDPRTVLLFIGPVVQGGAGAMASSGRGPAAILALYELLYVYEGQV